MEYRDVGVDVDVDVNGSGVRQEMGSLGVWDRTIHLLALAYDPFRHLRYSLLFRLALCCKRKTPVND